MFIEPYFVCQVNTKTKHEFNFTNFKYHSTLVDIIQVAIK